MLCARRYTREKRVKFCLAYSNMKHRSLVQLYFGLYSVCAYHRTHAMVEKHAVQLQGAATGSFVRYLEQSVTPPEPPSTWCLAVRVRERPPSPLGLGR